MFFSLYIQVIFQTPAPSAYYREKVWPQGEKKAPIYSMGSRTRYKKSKKLIIDVVITSSIECRYTVISFHFCFMCSVFAYAHHTSRHGFFKHLLVTANCKDRHLFAYRQLTVLMAPIRSV